MNYLNRLYDCLGSSKAVKYSLFFWAVVIVVLSCNFVIMGGVKSIFGG